MAVSCARAIARRVEKHASSTRLPDTTTLSPDMVAESYLRGRDDALQRLGGALEAAFQGRGQVVLVSGEAGMGKTAVATEIARQAEGRGAAVTWGRAWEFADAPPYFPVGPCLRALDVAVDGSDPFHLWESVAAALANRSREKPV